MKKVLLLAISLSFSLSSFASEFTCTGKNSATKIVVETTDGFGLVSKFDYSFKNKEIGTNVNQAGINTDLEKLTENLEVKFIVAKKHNGISKKSTLALTIKQASERGRGVVTAFELKETNEAQLSLVEDGTYKVIDELICH